MTFEFRGSSPLEHILKYSHLATRNEKNAPSSDANGLPPTEESGGLVSKLPPLDDDVSDDLWIILVLKYLARWWCDNRVWNTSKNATCKFLLLNINVNIGGQKNGRRCIKRPPPYSAGMNFWWTLAASNLRKRPFASIRVSFAEKSERVCASFILGPGEENSRIMHAEAAFWDTRAPIAKNARHLSGEKNSWERLDVIFGFLSIKPAPATKVERFTTPPFV